VQSWESPQSADDGGRRESHVADLGPVPGSLRTTLGEYRLEAPDTAFDGGLIVATTMLPRCNLCAVQKFRSSATSRVCEFERGTRRASSRVSISARSIRNSVVSVARNPVDAFNMSATRFLQSLSSLFGLHHSNFWHFAS